MYVPDAFRVEDRSDQLAFIATYEFATLVTVVEGEPVVSHLPLLLEVAPSGQATLRGHVARSNPHWQSFDGARTSLAIFHGPHAYISPSWYGPGPAVPTWNYAVVHVSGQPRCVEDPVRKRQVLDQLVERHESHRSEPWTPDLDERTRGALERAIVAFEFPIDQIVGKFKLGQNRSEPDRRGTLAGLEAAGDPASTALSEFTRRVAESDR